MNTIIEILYLISCIYLVPLKCSKMILIFYNWNSSPDTLNCNSFTIRIIQCINRNKFSFTPIIIHMERKIFEEFISNRKESCANSFNMQRDIIFTRRNNTTGINIFRQIFVSINARYMFHLSTSIVHFVSFETRSRGRLAWRGKPY